MAGNRHLRSLDLSTPVVIADRRTDLATVVMVPLTALAVAAVEEGVEVAAEQMVAEWCCSPSFLLSSEAMLGSGVDRPRGSESHCWS